MDTVRLNSIEYEWKDFATKVIPDIEVDSCQYREMKKSFFAGALVALGTLTQAGKPEVSEAEFMGWFACRYEEVKAFFKSEIKRYIEKN